MSFEAFQKREQERLAAAKMAEKETPVVYDRPEDDPFYKTAFCRFAQKGTCWFGDTCYYAHTDQELRKPPEGFEGPADQVGMTMNKGKPGEMSSNFCFFVCLFVIWKLFATFTRLSQNYRVLYRLPATKGRGHCYSRCNIWRFQLPCPTVTQWVEHRTRSGQPHALGE